MLRHKINYLDGIRLHRGLMAGSHRLLARQNLLNKINVFPVPDGDTGTNMGFTVLAIMDATGQVQSHAGRTAVAIADAALDGARGNSGVILAQFLQGFSDSCVNHSRLTVGHFAAAMQAGYEYALEAMSEPVEGTILSVIKAVSDHLGAQIERENQDFNVLVEESLEVAETALQKTPEQLAILKKNGVVDAGALGFVYLLKGVREFIADGSLRELASNGAEVVRPEIADQQVDAPGEDGYQFCTECMVLGQRLKPNLLKEQIIGLGNSLVIGGSKNRAKVHIHTNRPQEVFAVAARHGEVTGEKVDDMRKQVAVARGAPGRVAVVTDSTADIPMELVEELQIHVVPVKLSFGNTRYQDKVTITPEEFYEQLRTNPNHPKTSQPTPGDFWRQYQFLASHYDSIVSVHLPKPVSGTIQSAEIATKRLPDVHISVLDGANTAVGLGLVAVAVARAAHSGRSHDEVVAVAERAIAETVIYAAIQDLSWAVKGGRVAGSKKRVADLLRATPVLSVTDKRTVDMVGIFLGRKDLAKGLAKFSAKRVDQSLTYNAFISHAQAPGKAERLVQLLPEMGYKVEQVHITDTGAALGAHTGPGSLILALQPVGIA
ncbi:MAG: DegV family protein [Candidatus Neomarinimicrobiota bacterium]